MGAALLGSCSNEPAPLGGLMLVIGRDGPLRIDQLELRWFRTAHAAEEHLSSPRRGVAADGGQASGKGAEGWLGSGVVSSAFDRIRKRVLGRPTWPGGEKSTQRSKSSDPIPWSAPRMSHRDHDNARVGSDNVHDAIRESGQQEAPRPSIVSARRPQHERCDRRCQVARRESGRPGRQRTAASASSVAAS